jgi:hypothetical protein
MVEMRVDREPKNVKAAMTQLPRYTNAAVAEIANQYAEFLRNNYLSGQAIGVVSGATKGSVKFGKERSGVFNVRPGRGIAGSKNYLLRFERGNRPFMRTSWRAFRRSGVHKRITTDFIGRMLQRVQ